MDAQRWRQIEELFEAVLRRPAPERAAFLAAASRGDEELRRELESRLARESTGIRPLDQPTLEAAAQRLGGPPEALEATQEGELAPGLLLLKRFRVLRRIARGGMGVVYEAWDEKLERRIALKCAQAGYSRLLSPEVRLASGISHPNICRMFEVHTAETPDGPIDFVTMEFLEGPTLAQRLQDGSLGEHEARTVALQVCAGLSEAHRHKIIHGDLKPGNVILTRDPDGALRSVITDFGLARVASQVSTVGGTPGYMAPELFTGLESSVASDIFALGVMFYEALSGRLPYEPPGGKSAAPADVAIQSTVAAGEGSSPGAITQDGPPDPVHPKWDPILRRCLRRDPAQRYSSVDEIALALAPSKLLYRLLALAGALSLAALAALATWQRYSGPQESAQLDVATITSGQGLEAQSSGLEQAARERIARLQSSGKTRFSVVSADRRSRASHRLMSDLHSKHNALELRLQLKEARSDTAVAQWTGDYKTDELRLAPVAMAGFVSSALHLPAPAERCSVNAAASNTYRQALSLLRLDTRIDDATALMRRAIELDPDSALPHAGLAEALRREYFLTDAQMWLDQARQSLTQAEIRNPDCLEVHVIGGLIALDFSRREAALSQLLRATEFPQAGSDAFSRLGEVYQTNGQYADALRAYRHAVEIEPGYYRTHQALGQLYMAQANSAEAAKEFEIAVKLAPRVSQLRQLLGGSYQDQGRFKEAEATLRDAINMDAPGYPLEQLAQVLMYQGRDREASVYLQRAVEKLPEDVMGRTYLGLALQRAGRHAESRQAFLQGLEKAERAVVSRPGSGLDRARLAYLLAQTGQEAHAEREIQQALRLSPSNEDVLWVSALTYERMGKREDALRTLTAAARSLLEDLRRWPEASALTADSRFPALLSSSRASTR